MSNFLVINLYKLLIDSLITTYVHVYRNRPSIAARLWLPSKIQKVRHLDLLNRNLRHHLTNPREASRDDIQMSCEQFPCNQFIQTSY